MYHFAEGNTEDISHADIVLTATKKDNPQASNYSFRHHTYTDVHFASMTTARGYGYMSDDNPSLKELHRTIDDYNAYLDRLEQIPGFLEYFIDHGLCVSRPEIIQDFSEEIAHKVFTRNKYIFLPELTISEGSLFDSLSPSNYELEIDGTKIDLPIGKPAHYYPDVVNGKQTLWNWVDSGHDFCYDLWRLLGEQTTQYPVEDEEEDSYDREKARYDNLVFGYNDIRMDEPEIQLMRIFRKLEDLHYIQAYTIKPEHPDPRWGYCGKFDGTIDIALVDKKYARNKLLKEQIPLLQWNKDDFIKDHPYFLTDETDHQYLSTTPGAFGGHEKLKIYGRLDCPSAARYLRNGQYAQHRVFFKDQETAIKAGYRPCGVCMKAEYKKWKEDQSK